jgi:hypothetical protein
MPSRHLNRKVALLWDPLSQSPMSLTDMTQKSESHGIM